MNTIQIVRALEQDPITSNKFCGVFPSDQLPETIDKYPCGFVANTDRSTQPGTHWVAFYFPSEQKGEYFDSYGNNPNYYGKTFENYLNEHSYEWNFNKHKLQSNWSNVCGQYCIFYLSQRVRGHSMNKIVRMFDNNTMLNDAKVSHFVKTHFRVGVKSPNVNLTQFSKKLVQ